MSSDAVEKVADSLQAAQVLHGASVAESKALESQEQKKSRWERLKIAWKGQASAVPSFSEVHNLCCAQQRKVF